MNRIPFIRAAIDDKVTSSTDKITMDVIGLLFDYIFRDPSIPEELRSLFTRLQVPILKTALLDRSFFSDRKHPARRLLDHLAGAAIGATGDAGYRAAFELTAAGVIEEVCRDFQVDVGVFDLADRKVQEFVDAELQKGAGALGTEVAAALAAEEGEGGPLGGARADPGQALGSRRAVRRALVQRNHLGRLSDQRASGAGHRGRGMAPRFAYSRRSPVEPDGEGAQWAEGAAGQARAGNDPQSARRRRRGQRR